MPKRKTNLATSVEVVLEHRVARASDGTLMTIDEQGLWRPMSSDERASYAAREERLVEALADLLVAAYRREAAEQQPADAKIIEQE